MYLHSGVGPGGRGLWAAVVRHSQPDQLVRVEYEALLVLRGQSDGGGSCGAKIKHMHGNESNLTA